MPQAYSNLNSVRCTTWLMWALLGCGSAWGTTGSNNVPAAAPEPLRVAFSEGVVGEINPNDAKASIIVWGKALMASRNIVADIQANISGRTEDVFRAMEEEQLDGAGVVMDEFLALPAALKPEAVYLTVKSGKTTEQYVLLVHKANGITNLAGLKDQNLEIQKSSRSSLAMVWLDTCLDEQGLGLPESFFRKIERSEKASRVVLRVFFRQTEACVVTRETFETMCELNPQLHRNLAVVTRSPEVVPVVFFLRPKFTGRLRQELEAAMLSLHETVPGRQVLTVFQGDRLGKYPLTSLESSVDLLEASARVRSTTTDTNSENFLSAPPQ